MLSPVARIGTFISSSEERAIVFLLPVGSGKEADIIEGISETAIIKERQLVYWVGN